MNKEQIKSIENKILEADVAYREGNPIMLDAEYDDLIDQLKEVSPQSAVLKRGIIDCVSGKARLQKLPVPMFSLEKVKTESDIINWLQGLQPKTMVVLMPKYDGISVVMELGGEQKAWTRGNGVEGQISTSRFKCLFYCDESTLSISQSTRATYTWGEAIMPKMRFEKYLADATYKTARNMVAGQFNADEYNVSILNETDYVAYGCDSGGNKLDQLKMLSLISPHLKYQWLFVEDLLGLESLKNYFTELYQRWGERYNIDGIVMEIDSAQERESLGRLSNGNPKYSIAVKFPEWNDMKVAKVKGVTWKISKDGLAKPVINIEPTELCGVTVTKATAHNAAYVIDHHICEGALIQIRRSGDVIPKHDKTESYDELSFEQMCDDAIICPSCGKILMWDSSLVEYVCHNSNCRQKNIAKNMFFFVTMGIEEIGEPTVTKLYDAGYKTVKDIFAISKEAWCNIDGLGLSNYEIIFAQIEKLRSEPIPLAKLLTACNVFKGRFGEKTCQLIFNNLSDENLRSLCDDRIYPGNLIEKLCEVKGVGEIIAKSFISCMLEFDFRALSELKFKTYFREKEVQCEGKSWSVCFSGVRDKEMEAKLKAKGHSIASGVSKNTDLLVVKDVTGSSSKIEKAKTLNIPIMSIDDSDAIWNLINK